MRKLVSADLGYVALRDRIQSSEFPVMPLLPLYYSDLSFFESLGPLPKKKGDDLWINVEKLVGIAKTVKTLKNFQKSEYRFRSVDQIQTHILEYKCISQKEAEDIAVRLEVVTKDNTVNPGGV
jgi:hypothetical protein